MTAREVNMLQHRRFGATLVRRAHFLIVTAFVSACMNDAAPGDARGAGHDGGMTGPADAHAASTRSQSLLRHINASDWVGRVHNDYLTDFRRELRKPGILTRNVCSFLPDFVARRGGRDPRLQALSAHDFARSARAGLQTSRLCDVPVHQTSMAVTQEDDFQLTAPAASLVEQVSALAESAQSAASLASGLVPLIEAAQPLPELEREVVLASASVAQNSFEFWETQYAAMQQDFYIEYGACLLQVREGGYTMETGMDACLKGGTAYTHRNLEFSERLGLAGSLPGYSRRLDCGLAKNFRKVVDADIDGALAGGLKGIRGGLAGVAAGAAGGAAVASLAAYIKGTWDMFWCAM
jgi:hypothetical protein